MADLVFTIKTEAELAGAEQAARALETSIRMAKALAKDYSAREALKRINDARKGIAEAAELPAADPVAQERAAAEARR
jgi:hypothetical protein